MPAVLEKEEYTEEITVTPECEDFVEGKWDDLPENVKERVLEKQRDINVQEGFDWWDCTYDEWKEKLAEIGFTDSEIYFSGFWSQGDGACFDCKSVDLSAFVESYYKADVMIIPKKSTTVQ